MQRSVAFEKVRTFSLVYRHLVYTVQYCVIHSKRYIYNSFSLENKTIASPEFVKSHVICYIIFQASVLFNIGSIWSQIGAKQVSKKITVIIVVHSLFTVVFL